MSLRDYRDQIFEEERGFTMTAEQKRIEADAWNLTKEQVRDLAPCDLHVAVKGTFCARSSGQFYNCKARRIAASYAKARVPQP
jgi:succinylglutamate desuccinylase